MRGAGKRDIPPENIDRMAVIYVGTLVATGAVWWWRGGAAAGSVLFAGVGLVLLVGRRWRTG